jgi:type IV pilus modification protein PilV
LQLRYRQRGASMIEALSALFILGIGVLVFTGVQMRSMEMSMDSHKSDLANNIVINLADKIRINVGNQETKIEKEALLTVYKEYDWSKVENCSVIPPEVIECTTQAAIGQGCNSSLMAQYDAYSAKCTSSSLFKRTSMLASQCQLSSNLCIYYGWNDVEANADNCNDVSKECTLVEVFVQ